MTRRFFRLFSPVFLSLTCLLTACVSPLDLVGVEAPRLYELTPKSTFDDDLPEIKTRITIDVPSATAGLNTARIAVKPTPTQFEYYANALWVDVVPVMTQTLLLESFDNSDKIDVLERGAYNLQADYGLVINIREFQAEYSGDQPPDVLVRFQIRLVEMPRRQTIAATSVAGLATSTSKKMNDIIIAFDQAFGRAAKDVVDWTLRSIEKERVSN